MDGPAAGAELEPAGAFVRVNDIQGSWLACHHEIEFLLRRQSLCSKLAGLLADKPGKPDFVG